MKMTDIIVYIKAKVDIAERAEVEDQVRTLDGVIASRFAINRSNMLTVVFDSDLLSSVGLVRQINAMGLDAKLVAM